MLISSDYGIFTNLSKNDCNHHWNHQNSSEASCRKFGPIPHTSPPPSDLQVHQKIRPVKGHQSSHRCGQPCQCSRTAICTCFAAPESPSRANCTRLTLQAASTCSCGEQGNWISKCSSECACWACWFSGNHCNFAEWWLKVSQGTAFSFQRHAKTWKLTSQTKKELYHNLEVHFLLHSPGVPPGHKSTNLHRKTSKGFWTVVK